MFKPIDVSVKPEESLCSEDLSEFASSYLGKHKKSWYAPRRSDVCVYNGNAESDRYRELIRTLVAIINITSSELNSVVSEIADKGFKIDFDTDMDGHNGCFNLGIMAMCVAQSVWRDDSGPIAGGVKFNTEYGMCLFLYGLIEQVMDSLPKYWVPDWWKRVERMCGYSNNMTYRLRVAAVVLKMLGFINWEEADNDEENGSLGTISIEEARALGVING